MGNETKRGGKRPNTGRKKMLDKKVPVTIYVSEKMVNKVGKKELIGALLAYLQGGEVLPKGLITKPPHPSKQGSTPMPVREEGESVLDYAARKNEWKMGNDLRP